LGNEIEIKSPFKALPCSQTKLFASLSFKIIILKSKKNILIDKLIKKRHFAPPHLECHVFFEWPLNVCELLLFNFLPSSIETLLSGDDNIRIRFTPNEVLNVAKKGRDMTQQFLVFRPLSHMTKVYLH